MANRLFQIARNAVQQAVGKVQHSTHDLNNKISNSEHAPHAELSGHDKEVAQNALSSAMANSSDAERAQLAEFQKELDGHAGVSSSVNPTSEHAENQHTESGQPQSFTQATGLSLEDAESLLEDNPDRLN
ncbi:DUF3813 domain-containing protein [Fictibacillus sp. 5RED26]|jgi:Protein of unknown function (DUF3813)|uniref:DUF3813 domain-containing protein n=1 Tax=unclassified Fictibacillus TaxID=2644029 RepID=UPI0018CD717F|nr:DUF3813 domain-containing protein [Fictibacillus sp. 5RED26]MBH0166148.1 DUF3813 domain-containing protein [Fictibacillus sp. 7GRE50]